MDKKPLTAAQITEIRRLRAEGVLIKVIAHKVGASVHAVCWHSKDLSGRRQRGLAPNSRRSRRIKELRHVYEHMETRP